MAATENGTQPLNNSTQPPNAEPLEETYNSSRIRFGKSNVRLFNVKNAPAAVRAAHGFNTTPRKRKAILRPETPNFPNYPIEQQYISPSRKRPFGKSRVVTPNYRPNNRQTAAALKRAAELNPDSTNPQLSQRTIATVANRVIKRLANELKCGINDPQLRNFVTTRLANELNLDINDPQLRKPVNDGLATLQRIVPPAAAAAAAPLPFTMGPGPIAPFTMGTTPPASSRTLKRTTSTLNKGGKRRLTRKMKRRH